jgi:hypothetical protein
LPIAPWQLSRPLSRASAERAGAIQDVVARLREWAINAEKKKHAALIG